MMKKILFVAAACILAAACKPTETETTTASLEVTPTSLSFAAEDTAPQTITVTAVGVEWTYSLAESGKEWVTIERLSDKELTVAVADNTKAEQRTAAVTFKAKDNNRIKDRSVTIIQQGAENPEVYALTVDPTVLTFEAEGAAGQSVKVTASGEGRTWSAAVEDAAKEWITLSATEGTEGETTLTVAVADNPDTAERSANITITPSEETAGSKVIRISQEPKVLPPSFSLSYREGEVPEEGFTLNYRGYIEGNYTTTNHKIDIEAVNIDWQATVAYDSAVTNWI
ncbi:BACON domain-containing protein, partial [Alistipes putredinis]|uniref:BACON domain-containing protein n=1 Tax=Alistipes putredinis TaxID=28117 RepID=UPI003A93BE6E